MHMRARLYSHDDACMRGHIQSITSKVAQVVRDEEGWRRAHSKSRPMPLCFLVKCDAQWLSLLLSCRQGSILLAINLCFVFNDGNPRQAVDVCVLRGPSSDATSSMLSSFAEALFCTPSAFFWKSSGLESLWTAIRRPSALPADNAMTPCPPHLQIPATMHVEGTRR